MSRLSAFVDSDLADGAFVADILFRDEPDEEEDEDNDEEDDNEDDDDGNSDGYSE
jgi:hypothetical protein